MKDSDTPIVLVICNDYGELALALYLLEQQSFAQRTTLMLPPRLFEKNPDVLPGRTFVYHSIDDIKKEMQSKTPGILGLFSAYLLPIHRLCDAEELESLMRTTKTQGWNFFTSDPFLGLLENVEASELVTLKAPGWSLFWAFFASIEKKRLSQLLTKMHGALQDTLHVYPCGESLTDINRSGAPRLHFHNKALVSQVEQSPSVPTTGDAAAPPRWLFVLGDQDLTVQEGKYGQTVFAKGISRKFRKVLLNKLHETLEAGRMPTLIASEKVIDSVRKHSPAAETIELLPHCDYHQFQSLLIDAEYVFYWNAVSFSCLQRTLIGKPWFTYDEGHLLRGMNADYGSRILEWFFCGEEPPLLDIKTILSVDALQDATQQRLQSAWRMREGLLNSCDPQTLISAVSGLDEWVAAEGARGAIAQAFHLLEQVGEIVQANDLDGSVVVDTNLLPKPKAEISEAIKLLVEDGSEQQATFASAAAPTLAFFQPGVGEGRKPIDSPAPDGNAWKSTVAAEMVGTTESLHTQSSDASMIGALAIMQKLGETVAAQQLDGNTIVDISLLAHPKDEILDAVMLVVAEGVDEQATSVSSAAMMLAFFQPDIGPDRQSLDSPDPEGNPWREAVQAEMEAIAKSLS